LVSFEKQSDKIHLNAYKYLATDAKSPISELQKKIPVCNCIKNRILAKTHQILDKNHHLLIDCIDFSFFN
jgi:hypothetical protein